MYCPFVSIYPIDPEVRRYRINWIVIFCMDTLIGVSAFITLPSLHQFVTSSSHPEDPNVSQHIPTVA